MKRKNLLLSYNLISIINFPMRVQNTSATARDNIFIVVSQFESYTITPLLNGLSDHDAQLLMISTDYSHITLRGLSPHANYTDRAAAAGRRS